MTNPLRESSLMRLTVKVILATVMDCGLAYPALSGDYTSLIVKEAVREVGVPGVAISTILVSVLLVLAYWAKPLRVAGGIGAALICAYVSHIGFEASVPTGFVWIVLSVAGALLAATGVDNGKSSSV